MKPLPYRARQINDNEWVYGGLVEKNGRAWIVALHETPKAIKCGGFLLCVAYEVSPSSVSQSTGRKDKHGKEAYGGDRVRSSHYGKGQILWAGDGWCVQAEDMKFALHYEFEIIPEGDKT